MTIRDFLGMYFCCHCHSSESFEEWQDGTRQCTHCASTLVFSVEEMLNTLQMLHDEGILEQVDNHEIDPDFFPEDYDEHE